MGDADVFEETCVAIRRFLSLTMLVIQCGSDQDRYDNRYLDRRFFSVFAMIPRSATLTTLALDLASYALCDSIFELVQPDRLPALTKLKLAPKSFFLTDCPLLRSCIQIRTLELSGVLALTTGALDVITSLTNLTWLCIFMKQLPATILPNWHLVSRLVNLHHLFLAYVALPADFLRLVQSPMLRSLSLRCIRGITELSYLPVLPRLTDLDIECYDAATSLAFPNPDMYRKLEDVTLEFSDRFSHKKTTLVPGPGSVFELANLRSLCVTDLQNSFGVEFAKLSDSKKSLPLLQTVESRGPAETFSERMALDLACVAPNLTSLYVNADFVCGDALSALLALKHLQYLSMRIPTRTAMCIDESDVGRFEIQFRNLHGHEVYQSLGFSSDNVDHNANF